MLVAGGPHPGASGVPITRGVNPPRAGIAGCLAAALVLGGCGGSDDKDKGSAPPDTTSSNAKKPPAGTEPMATTKAPPSALLKKRRRDRAETGIQTAVTNLVSTAERGDGAGFCKVLGRKATAAGSGALQSCAQAAGVPAEQLPTSDELSIQKVQLQGAAAVVTIVPGTRITLRKQGDAWIVSSVRAAAP